MSGPRTIVHSVEDQQLKTASRALVRAFGGQEPASVHLRTRQQRLSDCGLKGTPDFLRIDEVAALEDDTHGQPGHPHVTAALAARQGFVLLRRPSVAATGRDLLHLIALQSKESGEIVQRVCEAISDKRITVDEAGASVPSSPT